VSLPHASASLTTAEDRVGRRATTPPQVEAAAAHTRLRFCGSLPGAEQWDPSWGTGQPPAAAGEVQGDSASKRRKVEISAEEVQLGTRLRFGGSLPGAEPLQELLQQAAAVAVPRSEPSTGAVQAVRVTQTRGAAAEVPQLTIGGPLPTGSTRMWGPLPNTTFHYEPWSKNPILKDAQQGIARPIRPVLSPRPRGPVPVQAADVWFPELCADVGEMEALVVAVGSKREAAPPPTVAAVAVAAPKEARNPHVATSTRQAPVPATTTRREEAPAPRDTTTTGGAPAAGPAAASGRAPLTAPVEAAEPERRRSPIVQRENTRVAPEKKRRYSDAVPPVKRSPAKHGRHAHERRADPRGEQQAVQGSRTKAIVDTDSRAERSARSHNHAARSQLKQTTHAGRRPKATEPPPRPAHRTRPAGPDRQVPAIPRSPAVPSPAVSETVSEVDRIISEACESTPEVPRNRARGRGRAIVTTHAKGVLTAVDGRRVEEAACNAGSKRPLSKAEGSGALKKRSVMTGNGPQVIFSASNLRFEPVGDPQLGVEQAVVFDMQGEACSSDPDTIVTRTRLAPGAVTVVDAVPAGASVAITVDVCPFRGLQIFVNGARKTVDQGAALLLPERTQFQFLNVDTTGTVELGCCWSFIAAA